MSDKVLVSNAADKGQVKNAEKVERTERDKELDDLRFVMGVPQGRRVLFRILDRCGVYRSSFTGNSQTYFNEGERNIGLYVLSEMTEAKEERIFQMMRENKAHRKKEK